MRAWADVCLARAYSGLGDYSRAVDLAREVAAVDGHPGDAWAWLCGLTHAEAELDQIA
jgi:hypothetical protein